MKAARTKPFHKADGTLLELSVLLLDRPFTTQIIITKRLILPVRRGLEIPSQVQGAQPQHFPTSALPSSFASTNGQR